jgi:hypothetical protein
MKRLQFHRWSVPIALFLLCLAGYGLLIRWLGFYQDDWYQIWFGRAFGSSVFINYYDYERPFIAGLYLLTTPFLGVNPTTWQIFGLICRWLSALSVWWALGLVWKNRLHRVAWIAILFAVYPGFRQQFASVIYSHYFLQFAIQMASIGAMLLAVRRPRWFWPLTLLAWLGALVGIFSSEYFFGLELLRPVFLWLGINEEQSIPPGVRRRRFFLQWLPYLLFLAGFLFWRIFIFKFPTYQPILHGASTGGFLALIFQLARTILTDVLETGLIAWAYPLGAYLKFNLRQPSLLVALGLAVICAVALAFYLLRLHFAEDKQPTTPKSERNFALGLVGLGIYALLGSGWPFWFVGLPVNLALDGGSRLTLSFMLGASLLMVGLIELLLRKKSWQIVVVAILAGLAVGHHFLDANTYRQVHERQATFFQQLAWRAPGIQPGTLVLSDAFNDLPFSGDNSLTAALNWIYDPEPPYAMEYYFTHALADLTPGQPVEKAFRTTIFHGSTSAVLVIVAPPNGCLRLFSPELDLGLPRPVELTKEIKEALPLSNPARVITNPARPASLTKELFKVIPAQNSWCYDYEKADLAVQQKNWAEAARLADLALAGQHKLDNTWEILPYIDGYAQTAQFEKAAQLSSQALQASPEGKKTTQALLCAAWTRIASESAIDSPTHTVAWQTLLEMGCP